jgi:hypothetical protein
VFADDSFSGRPPAAMSNCADAVTAQDLEAVHGRARARVAAGVLLVALIAAIAPAGANAAGAAARPRPQTAAAVWAVQRQFGPPIAQMSAIACPSATVCYAVGSTLSNGAAIALTTDGGTTWNATAAGVPSGIDKLRTVACPSATNHLRADPTRPGMPPCCAGATAGRPEPSRP